MQEKNAGAAQSGSQGNTIRLLPGAAICRALASDLLVHSGATEATLRMDTICPATQLAHLASLIPEMLHQWLPTLGPGALILRWLCDFRARHCLKWSFCAKATLWVYSIGVAAQHSIFTLWVPIIGYVRQGVEFAHVGSWTMDIFEPSAAAETALHMLAICVAPMHACVARGIPEIRSRWLIGEGALRVSLVHRTLWAWNTCEWVVAAEATLLMDSICPAAKLTH